MGRIKEGYIVRFTFPWGETSLATLKVINVYRGEVIIRHLGTMNTVSVKSSDLKVVARPKSLKL